MERLEKNGKQVVKQKLFLKSMNIKWNLQGCGGVPKKKHYMESMDIFWKKTISIPVMDSKEDWKTFSYTPPPPNQ